jgi:Domain of unknown function (DUF4437)
MARPHICFVQAQAIPWSAGLPGGARDDVAHKLLSRDDLDGSSTMVVRYPAGWRRDGAEYLDAHEEFLVLDGAIEIDGRSYGRHAYAFLPAGRVRHRASSSAGAVLLTMWSGVPRATAAVQPPAGLYDPALLVAYVDPLAMEWDPGLVDPQLARGVAIKPLRRDPYTGEVSFLYCSPPHRVPPGMAKPQWTHPMVEELYVIEGEYCWGDLGVMRRGGYCWWRENVYHGPAGTETGYNLFVRTIGGPLVNVFDTVKKPFTWNPEHRPSLPPELQPYGQPWPREPNY